MPRGLRAQAQAARETQTEGPLAALLKALTFVGTLRTDTPLTAGEIGKLLSQVNEAIDKALAELEEGIVERLACKLRPITDDVLSDQHYTLEFAADYLGYSLQTVRTYVFAGKFPSVSGTVRVGPHYQRLMLGADLKRLKRERPR